MRPARAGTAQGPLWRRLGSEPGTGVNSTKRPKTTGPGCNHGESQRRDDPAPQFLERAKRVTCCRRAELSLVSPGTEDRLGRLLAKRGTVGEAPGGSRKGTAVSYQQIVQSASQRIEQLVRCIVCERVVGQYVVREPLHLIIKCQRCGALQTRHLQMTVVGAS